MGSKKGVARRLVLPCSVEEGDEATFTGPDDDGDITVSVDVQNEPEVQVVFNRRRQEELYAYLGRALGKTEKSED